MEPHGEMTEQINSNPPVEYEEEVKIPDYDTPIEPETQEQLMNYAQDEETKSLME